MFVFYNRNYGEVGLVSDSLAKVVNAVDCLMWAPKNKIKREVILDGESYNSQGWVGRVPLVGQPDLSNPELWLLRFPRKLFTSQVEAIRAGVLHVWDREEYCYHWTRGFPFPKTTPVDLAWVQKVLERHDVEEPVRAWTLEHITTLDDWQKLWDELISGNNWDGGGRQHMEQVRQCRIEFTRKFRRQK